MKRVWICLLALLLFCLPALGEAPQATELPATDAPEAEQAPEAAQPAKGYVLVTTATQVGWLPLPEEEEYTFPLQQTLPDGTECMNLIHVTPEGVYMEDSTCEGHDCVQQGTVTLENRDERILYNMIICLPNQVMLQLFTPEEVLEMMQQGEGQ